MVGSQTCLVICLLLSSLISSLPARSLSWFALRAWRLTSNRSLASSDNCSSSSSSSIWVLISATWLSNDLLARSRSWTYTIISILQLKSLGWIWNIRNGKYRAAPAILPKKNKLNLHFYQHHPCFPLKLQAPTITIIQTLISTVDTRPQDNF